MNPARELKKIALELEKMAIWPLTKKDKVKKRRTLKDIKGETVAKYELAHYSILPSLSIFTDGLIIKEDENTYSWAIEYDGSNPFSKNLFKNDNVASRETFSSEEEAAENLKAKWDEWDSKFETKTNIFTKTSI